MKNVKEMVLRRLENQVEEENVVEEVKGQISEADLMQLVMDEVNSKTITLSGEFNDDMVNRVKAQADQIWYYEQDETRNLYVDIISHGGMVCSLFAILDILQNLKDEWNCNIVTRALGFAESCGFITFCFGDERQMGNHAELMCHEISYGYQNKVSEHQKELKRTKRIQDKVDKIICEKTGLTKQQLRKWYKEGDKFIDREEAMKLGILTVYDEDNKENE